MDTIGSVEALRDDLEAEERTGAEELAEETYSDEDSTVAEAVPYTIEEGFPRTVTQSEGFEATHEDTVRDDQPDEDGELLADIVSISLKDFADDGHQGSCYDELHDDADTVRDRLTQERDDDVGEGDDDRHRECHDDSGLELRGYSQRRADTEHLHHDGVVLAEWPEERFFILFIPERHGY